MSVVILRGDAASLPLADESVDLVVTSPPYWGQRSYADAGEHYDGQIGDEPAPGEYIANLLACTREWMRVLKPSGSLFVNLGDKYAGGGQGGNVGGNLDGGEYLNRTTALARTVPAGFRAKSLMLLPQRYAIGCTDQLGLILRRDIIWSKLNGLPESVTDRCRSSHEYLFHLTKQARYFAAVDEIREPLVDPQRKTEANAMRARNASLPGGMAAYGGPNPLGVLPGSVWEIASQPLSVPEDLEVDHYAAFPVALPRRIVLGWSPSGICMKCGEGRRPVTRVEQVPLRPGDRPGIAGLNGDRAHGFDRRAGTHVSSRNVITGYACACTPYTDHPDLDDWDAPPTRPAIILDPFGGTGTTALVADVLGRTGVTVDRSADYCRLAAWRTADPAERARALGVPKPPPVIDGQGSLFDGLEGVAG